MEVGNNIKIVERMLELAKNELVYSAFPKSYKEEYIFLPNHLFVALRDLEEAFSQAFRKAVGEFKSTLKEKRQYGWFYNPENLVYIKMQINQLLYIIYGERYVREIKFNEELGKEAYKDLINQIDRTVLMTPEELIQHNADIERISKEICDEFMKEKNNQ